MTDELRLASELMDVTTALRRQVRRTLRAGMTEPLPAAQIEVLRVVADHPGIGVAAAAERLRLAGNSVSTLVNQLTAAGLMSRGTDPADRRAARLELTPTAHARLTEWRDRRARLVATRLAALPDGDRDAIAAAIPALARLVASEVPS